MKLRPGCGCLILVLGLINLVFLLSAIVGAARQTSLSSTVLSILMVVVFIANVVVCALVGWAALRSRKQAPSVSTVEEGSGSESEGEEAGD